MPRRVPPAPALLIPAGLALAGYAVWQVHADPDRIHLAIWFLGAVVGHDLVLFPLYAGADGLLVRLARRSVNYLRVPLLASGLTFLLFLPGIIRQGAGSYLAATGLTQQPFLARWLWLVAGFFAASALVFLIRRVLSRRRERTVGTGPGAAARPAQ
jgi:hypothetical protein